MEKEYIQLNGKQIALVDTKVGEDIVFVLHGWGAMIESIMPIVNVLKDKYRVIAYDAYGHGDSDGPDEVIGGEEYMELLHALYDYFGVESAHCIGHSFGGKTLTLFASRYPEKVKRLVLIDASGVKPKRKLSYYVKVYSFKLMKFLYRAAFFWKDREEAMKSFYRNHGSDDYRAADGIMRKVFVKVVNENTEDVFPKIKAETLLIWGDRDDATPLYMAEVFEKNIPGAGLVVLEGGHYSYLDAFGQFSAVLRSFL